MRIIEFPKRENWDSLIERPSALSESTARDVAEILSAVRQHGDEAIRRISQKFDKCVPDTFAVSDSELLAVRQCISPDLKTAIATAYDNIRRFHQLSDTAEYEIETFPGVFCGRKRIPIERVGLYIPAGSAPLFSTVLMLAIPAKLAGCEEIIMCSPPSGDGTIDAATLYAASLCGVSRIYKIGGAQAIAAMTFGTETVPKVDKIFGPGNRYVTEAKLQILRYGVAIDMPAGPSELLVIADDTCRPDFVAADLLSQAEHGPDSQVILLTESKELAGKIIEQIEQQIADLQRRDIAYASLANSAAIILRSIEECLDFSNLYAPEHLILAVENAGQAALRIKNAGSVFIGNYACESAGDYASGTNHTLPTGGAARGFSGVTTESFMKTITFQRITSEGISRLAPTIETMAAAEGLEAHRRAAAIRRKEVEK
jgi:histidinol dehydrogenase